MGIKLRRGPAKAKSKAKKPKAQPKAGSSAEKGLPKELHASFSTILVHMSQVEDAKTLIETTKEEISGLLEEIKEGGPTSFKYGKTYYSIRSRGGTSYVVKSDVPFGSWRKKK